MINAKAVAALLTQHLVCCSDLEANMHSLPSMIIASLHNPLVRKSPENMILPGTSCDASPTLRVIEKKKCSDAMLLIIRVI